MTHRDMIFHQLIHSTVSTTVRARPKPGAWKATHPSHVGAATQVLEPSHTISQGMCYQEVGLETEARVNPWHFDIECMHPKQ